MRGQRDRSRSQNETLDSDNSEDVKVPLCILLQKVIENLYTSHSGSLLMSVMIGRGLVYCQTVRPALASLYKLHT